MILMSLVIAIGIVFHLATSPTLPPHTDATTDHVSQSLITLKTMYTSLHMLKNGDQGYFVGATHAVAIDSFNAPTDELNAPRQVNHLSSSHNTAAPSADSHLSLKTKRFLCSPSINATTAASILMKTSSGRFAI